MYVFVCMCVCEHVHVLCACVCACRGGEVWNLIFCHPIKILYNIFIKLKVKETFKKFPMSSFVSCLFNS